MFLLGLTTNPWIVMARNRIAFFQTLETRSMQTLAQQLNLTAQRCWGKVHRRTESQKTLTTAINSNKGKAIFSAGVSLAAVKCPSIVITAVSWEQSLRGEMGPILFLPLQFISTVTALGTTSVKEMTAGV